MLDITTIRDQADAVQQNCINRGVHIDIAALLELDDQRRALQQALDGLKAERNTTAASLQTMADKSSAEAQAVIARGKELKALIAEQETAAEVVTTAYQELLLQVPNLTHPDSPLGKDDTENKELRQWGTVREFDFVPKDHVALGQDLDWIDFDTATQVAGRGFYYLKNTGALLELALVNYAMQHCAAAGFMPMITPDLARHEVLSGTGFQPRGPETQIYTIEGTDLSLIATAEITVAGYYKDKLFTADELKEPIRIVALSHCFRTEAGAYGRESRGLYRVHQFTKVEMFVICTPDQSEAEHAGLLQIEEQIMQGLELPYRVVDICTGDLGGPAYRKYDIEAWMPFKNDWGEVTSTSNCTDFQARRLNMRHLDAAGKKHYVHTLNGTAIVGSRIPICLMENFQTADGQIKLPQSLTKWMM